MVARDAYATAQNHERVDGVRHRSIDRVLGFKRADSDAGDARCRHRPQTGQTDSDRQRATQCKSLRDPHVNERNGCEENQERERLEDLCGKPIHT